MGKWGTGLGSTPEAQEVQVRFAPPGSRVHAVPTGRKKGVWTARRTALIRPPLAWTPPRCPSFALCGGCALQELRLDAQRVAKDAYGRSLVEDGLRRGGRDLSVSVRVHAPRGIASPYEYRNKVELSFGPSRFLREEALRRGEPIEGRFLGFHAPGRYDRVVDVDRCHLVGESLNRLLAVTRAVALSEDAPSPYDPRDHSGFWRHLVLRRGMATGQTLAVLHTAPADERGVAAAARWGEAVRAADLGASTLAGALWVENAGLADVVRGEVREVWGRDWFEEQVLGRTFRLSATSFFQTSTAGAELLYRTVGEALGEGGGTLLDLYCGVGTIGLVLADRFDRVLGVEERAEAVADAQANAERNGVDWAEWRAGRVEDVLDLLQTEGALRAIVVDPPRPGLHPRVAEHLSQAVAEVLVYVACNPASLGRDAAVLMEGGWRLTDLWTVDLFPQTGHVEMVGRFSR
ncbi:MAG: 23S rRNA (uracil(1939)-C(5))-methyltransferase RlmD [Deltaproteobacteria bacterium]|nr:23S rRNA (uracil(1939)-C(5))-methyltransferase RlmD [Deltaproteobacteria bacterium]